MANASAPSQVLEWGASTAGGAPDFVASEIEFSSVPLDKTRFSFQAIEGATYWFASSSFFDPVITLYDDQGRAVAFSDDEATGDTYGTDYLHHWDAPKNGTFYVDPGWRQGSASQNKLVTLIVSEDRDTANSSVVFLNPALVDKREGSGDAPTTFTFSVDRSGGLNTDVAVSYRVTSTSMSASEFGGGAMPRGKAFLFAGETTKPITVQVIADRAVEPNETFQVVLEAPENATIHDVNERVTGRVRNDDSHFQGPPSIGASPDFLFDPAYYLWSSFGDNPTVTGPNALNHYKTIGAPQGKDPTFWFDADYYEQRWADLAPLNLSEVDLFAHFNLYGVWEGRSPSLKFHQFDGTRYLSDNPDVAAYVDAYVNDFLGSRTNGAVAHFIIYGANEGRGAYDTAGKPIDMDYLT